MKSATGRRCRAPTQSIARHPRAISTGLPPLRQGRNLRIKPFLAGGAVRGVGEGRFDRDLSAGVDLKAGITPSLTFDATINPDFAQAEADEQQVNLTQFSLFFPEKREFFLENAGIFYFGDIPRNQRQASRFRPPEEDLLLFFSRRVGLTDSGEQEPLLWRRAPHGTRRRLHARHDDDAEQGR